jgi:hypothetical protein
MIASNQIETILKRMIRVKIPTVYERIRELKPRRVALVTQAVNKKEVYVQKEKQIDFALRDLEERFRGELTGLGIECIPILASDESQLTELKAPNRFDLIIYCGEECYQSLQLANRQRSLGVSTPLLLELTQEATDGRQKQAIESQAKRLGAEDLVNCYVWLSKTKRSPRNVEFDLNTSTESSPKKRKTVKLSRSRPSSIAVDLSEPPKRMHAHVCRIIRDTRQSQWVKQQHNFECQICGTSIHLADGSKYAEAHHVKPLGSPHDGPDVTENIVCVCPNHHAELDYGVRTIEPHSLRLAPDHKIDSTFINYHNEKIHLRKP